MKAIIMSTITTTNLGCQFSFFPLHGFLLFSRRLWLSAHICRNLWWRLLALENKKPNKQHMGCEAQLAWKCLYMLTFLSRWLWPVK